MARRKGCRRATNVIVCKSCKRNAVCAAFAARAFASIAAFSALRAVNRFVSFLRLALARCRARVAPFAAGCAARLRAALRGAAHALRHPTRRGIALTLAAIPTLAVLVLLAFVPFTPSIGDIRKARIERPARVLSADGKLIAEFRPVNREWVPLKLISPHTVDALIATEDRRFYAHHGIDWRRTLAAALHTFGGERQGGSTITQQLARNLYPD